MGGNRNEKVEEELCPRSVARNLEHQINTLLDDTAVLTKDGNFQEALEKAKLAVKILESLKKQRQDHSLSDVNIELTFAVWFSMALAYETNDLLEDAVKTYTFLAKQRGHPLSSRVRINLGNIYYAQHEYPTAIKMYKMAMDQTRNDRKAVASIRRNMGNAFFRLGHLRDAVKNFEESMNTHPNHQTGFNLLICHLALGDAENTKKDLTKLVKLRRDSPSSIDDGGEECMDETTTIFNEINTKDETTNRALFAAARLVARSMDSKELISILQDGHEHLAMKIEHEQAIHRLINNDLKTAVKTLKSLETKSREMRAPVATNLSLVHFLEGDVDIASSYADIALGADRYNAKALVNKGNIFFANEHYSSAKDLYLEAIGVEANCAQAIFNLGLSYVRLHEPEEAIRAFEKLYSITPNNPTVIYQIADINENQGETQSAMKWFNVLAASRSSDSTILSRLAYLFSKTKDEAQSLHYHLESFRHFPVDLDVIAWIGAWFIQQEMFEKSIYFFQQAALIQPNEIKWGK
ncbi:hypothetical protein HJC23_005203 [Cyclotella cryptica]|uniref:Uncharacterized protein n=1 Tax=Cyclotella cryptica TaxID=29204 RepID=A0ABD3P2N2_9STRA